MSNEITITVADASIPEYWEKQTLRYLYAERVIAKPEVVLWKAEKDAVRGDKINFTEMGVLTAGAIAEAGTFTNTAQSQTNRSISLTSHIQVSIVVPWRTKRQSVVDYASEFGATAGEALGQNMDGLITALYSSISTNKVGSTTAPTILTDANVRAAIAKLDKLNVKQRDRTFVMHPQGKSDLLADSDFRLAYATGLSKGGQVTGELPPLYGIKYVLSTKVTDATTYWVNMLLQKECIGFGMSSDIKIHNASGLAGQVAGDIYLAEYLGGAAVLRESLGCLIHSAQ